MLIVLTACQQDLDYGPDMAKNEEVADSLRQALRDWQRGNYARMDSLRTLRLERLQAFEKQLIQRGDTLSGDLAQLVLQVAEEGRPYDASNEDRSAYLMALKHRLGQFRDLNHDLHHNLLHPDSVADRGLGL